MVHFSIELFALWVSGELTFWDLGETRMRLSRGEFAFLSESALVLRK